MNPLSIPDSDRRWDCLSLGEVMLRLDPSEGRIHTARQFQVWEGGGEYNVARGLRRCFGMRVAIATALADNPVGRLVEDFIPTVASIPRLFAGFPTTASVAPSAMASILLSVASAFAPPLAAPTAVIRPSARSSPATLIGTRYSAARTVHAGCIPAVSSPRFPLLLPT